MTNLICNLQDILGTPIEGGVVRLSAENIQSDGLVTLLPKFREEPLVDGSVTFDGVRPGRVVIQVAWDGNTRTIRAYVPNVESITLSDLQHQVYDTQPAVVGKVIDAANRAESAAYRAEDAADAFGSLEGVTDLVQDASDSAQAASGSASAASSSASAAATSESNAAGSASSAGTSASSAASAASAAAGSASTATGAASAAASSASAADSAATRAEGVADSTHWQGDRLSVMGQLGPSLKGPKGDPGAPGDGSGDVSWSELDPVLAGKAPVSHDHTASQISDATTTGRNVLTATTQAAARTAIGAGTSNLAIGTTASTAKAGNYQPTAANISDATTVGRAVLKATDAEAARTAIGAAAVGEGGTGGAWVLTATLPTSPDPDTLYLIPED